MQAEWQAWIDRHAAIFALTTEQDARMLMEWCGLFAAAGWTPAELTEATDWIALHSPPRFRSEHLAALQERVRGRRQGRPPADEAPDEMGRCTLCHGAGLVSVPSPKALALDRWGTMAVACHCALGLWFSSHGGHLALNVYEVSFPDWRERVRQHTELLTRRTRTSAATKAVDDALGEIERRVRLWKREPGEDG